MKTDKRPRVLIVDDVPSNVEILATALGDRYEVCFACSGRDGLDLAVRYPPDLVLLDVMMPDMDGFETCSRFHALDDLNDVPVIFISALEEVDDKVKAFRSGGSDYVTKPFQAEEVLARVSTQIALYQTRRQLYESEQTLRQHVSELESANQRLQEMGKQLLRAEKLAATGQLAAGVAHEINNPLGFVVSNLGTLARYASDLLALVDAYADAEPDLPQDRRALLAAHRQAVDLAFLREDASALIADSRNGLERVRIIVQKLLEFSRDIDEPAQMSDLNALLDESLQNLGTACVQSVAVVKEYGDLPPLACAKAQIGQVFASLLKNALQSMPGGGRLILRTEANADGIAIHIIDNGCGIPPEIQDRLFDPFFTTRPVGQGAGLGLSVAYGIVEHHGGRLEFFSTPGEGSCFSVTLPLDRNASALVSD